MKPFHSLHALAGGAAAISIVCSATAYAQIGDLGALVDKGLAAMEAGQWEEALALHTEAVERFSNNALTLHGPRFGVIYYRKGFCELRLRKWEDAIKSFEVCYRDFPNDAAAGGGNVFEKMALLRWGEAAVGSEQWELAITQFKKFLEEHDRTRDNYPQGTFHINMAICHYNLGQFPEGNENLEIAIKNKDRFPTSESGIIAAFQALVGAATSGNNEQALLDFIGKNRGELTFEPYLMHRFSNLFMKLAADAISAEMPAPAIALYQFVPPTVAARDDLDARIRMLGKINSIRDGATNYSLKQLADELAVVESTLKGNKMPEATKLAATAFLHERAGNVRGAAAAYIYLEKFFSNSERREDNLYNLVRTQSILGETANTQANADKFLTTFPDSAHAPTVKRLTLSALFYDGEYEACIRVAEPMLTELEQGTSEHDLCLHVLGGSYFYTGRYEAAQEKLDEHVETYPESDFALSASYFQAANESRRHFWTKAASMLDAFLEKYPDPDENIFYPFALYDRANAHYSEDQNEGALEKISRILTEFPDSRVVDGAHNLRGNIRQSDGDEAGARESYLKALETAESRNNPVVAGEAILYLVAMLGDKEETLEEAVPYADKYWESYADGSPYQTQMAVAQIRAMNAAGRGEEALSRLRDVISLMVKNPESAGLEQAINSYTEVYLEKYTPDELKEHYYNFPGITSTDRAARALLRIAIIGVFEEVSRKAESETDKRNAAAMIQVLFRELRTDFALQDLNNYILVKLGDYIRTNTSNPAEALPFYDEALGRQDQSHLFTALRGRADVYGRSAIAAEVDKGIADFQRVYSESKDNGEREFSLFRIIELLMAKHDHAGAAEQALVYLGPESGFKRHSAEVGLILAQSFDRRNMMDDAISMYMKVWSAHIGYIKISAPAVKRWMELSWQRNTPGAADRPADRQGAYEGGARYVDLTERLKDKMSPEETGLWTEVQRLTQSYEADPHIKSMEELKRERERAANSR